MRAVTSTHASLLSGIRSMQPSPLDMSLRHKSSSRVPLTVVTQQRHSNISNKLSTTKPNHHHISTAIKRKQTLTKVMATHPEDWTCTICYDAFPASEKYCEIPDQNNGYHYRACAACLQTQFLSAQENEMSYPVKWQKQILHPRQFPGAFNRTFV